MSNTDLFGNRTLIGLKVRLDRPVDRERPCCLTCPRGRLERAHGRRLD
jgi:hypothetical protein